MTVLDWVLPFWTLAPYSSKSSSPGTMNSPAIHLHTQGQKRRKPTPS